LKNRITLLLLAGVCLLCALGAVFVVLGPMRDEAPGTGDSSAADGSPSARSSRDASEPPDFDPQRDRDRPDIRRFGEISPGTTSQPDADSADLLDEQDVDSRSGEASSDVIDPASLPMATKGRERGIDTAMDDEWSPGGEAEQWFSPLRDAFEAARPLTPDLYNEILGDHRETTVDVFKRAGEIGELEGPEAGIQFLDEYNAEVDAYKREAYGEAPR